MSTFEKHSTSESADSEDAMLPGRAEMEDELGARKCLSHSGGVGPELRWANRVGAEEHASKGAVVEFGCMSATFLE